MNESNKPTNTFSLSNKLIADCYKEFLPGIINYINSKIGDYAQATDIAQDAFVKLIEYKPMLRKETLRSFIYTIARNMTIDYIRHQYCKQEASANMMEFSKAYQESEESHIHVNDILKLENGMIMSMPQQRRNIYIMDRFEDKTADEIAIELCISKRTVESHLYTSRKVVRDYLKKCI